MPFSRSAFSGFPFDREDRDDHFRSQLDDIANRHPEFAEHFAEFPFRSHTLGRSRPPRSDRDFRSRFGSRFDDLGFSFNDPFEEEFRQEKTPQPQEAETPKPEEKPKPERSRKQNIQPSNTVDLGQKQEPVNDRNQRSMSAPPPDHRQRYVSSIHIPVNQGMGEMGKAQSQQQQEKPQSSKPMERVIPIHVEGRDEPVIPKHTGPSFSQQQPERIFGQSPSQFTQFVGKEPPRQQKFQQPQQKFQQEVPPQAQAPPPQQQTPQPQQEQVPPQPKQQPNTAIDIIQSVQKDVSQLMNQVEKFNGAPRDKQYLYLDEMLTRNLIKLDDIDTQGQENIRQARREAIKCIQGCIGILEAKAAANVAQPKEDKMEVEEEKKDEVKEEPKPEEPPKMEVEADPEQPQQTQVEDKPDEEMKEENKPEVKEEQPEATTEEKKDETEDKTKPEEK